MDELRDNLNIFFGDIDILDIDILDSTIVSSVVTDRAYTINVTLRIPFDTVVSMIRSGEMSSSVDYGTLLTIGSYEPSAWQMRHNILINMREGIVTYYTWDIDAFMVELKNATWKAYNHKMNDLIDEVISKEDT